MVNPLMDIDNRPIGGSTAYYLSEIVNYYNSMSDIDPLIRDVSFDMIHSYYVNEDYSMDDATYIASYDGYFIFGYEDSPTHPDNTKIPLTDFRDLLLEWKNFLSQEGIS